MAQHPALLVMTSRVEGDSPDEAWRAEAAGTSLLRLLVALPGIEAAINELPA